MINICFISEVPEAHILESVPPRLVYIIGAYHLHIWKSIAVGGRAT